MTDAPAPARWLHDLKNQLGIVLGFSELLLNELEPGSAHRADLEEIHTPRSLPSILWRPRPRQSLARTPRERHASHPPGD